MFPIFLSPPSPQNYDVHDVTPFPLNSVPSTVVEDPKEWELKEDSSPLTGASTPSLSASKPPSYFPNR